MNKWIKRLFGLAAGIIVIVGCVQFEAWRCKQAIMEELRANLGAKNYTEARMNIANLRIRDLRKFASKINNKPLLQAIKVVDRVDQLSKEEKIKLLQAALFVETEAVKEGTFFPKETTNLAYDIEYHPETDQTFIHLDKLLGKGRKKMVYYSLLYSNTRPELVARALSETSMDREIAVTKLCKDSAGIYGVVALTERILGEKKAAAIISKLYNHGSLYKLFSRIYRKKMKPLSHREKVVIAAHILQGLSSLHEKGIVHRDLSSKNYFVSLQPAPNMAEGRKIEVAVADLERALHTKLAKVSEKLNKVFDEKVQGNRSYTPPEAIMQTYFEPQEFFAMDIYAAGCVLYELLYEKRPDWRRTNLGKDGRSREETYRVLLEELQKGAETRRIELLAKDQKNSQEEFELIVLQMLQVDPSSRGQASEIKDKLDLLVAKL